MEGSDVTRSWANQETVWRQRCIKQALTVMSSALVCVYSCMYVLFSFDHSLSQLINIYKFAGIKTILIRSRTHEVKTIFFMVFTSIKTIKISGKPTESSRLELDAEPMEPKPKTQVFLSLWYFVLHWEQPAAVACAFVAKSPRISRPTLPSSAGLHVPPPPVVPIMAHGRDWRCEDWAWVRRRSWSLTEEQRDWLSHCLTPDILTVRLLTSLLLWWCSSKPPPPPIHQPQSVVVVEPYVQ